jgi:hypothetical protein
MKKSPLNFLGLAQITSGLFGGRNRQPNRRKNFLQSRVRRLEREVKTLMDDRKQINDVGEGQSVLGAPTIDNTMPAQSEQLLPPQPTLASRAMMEGMTGAPSFNLGKGQEMFGDSIPGSFDRDMGV